MRARRVAALAVACMVAAGVLTAAAIGPPLIPSDAAETQLEQVRPDFRYRPQSAFDRNSISAMASSRDQRWEGRLDRDDEFEVLEVELETGRYLLSYSLTGAFTSITPARIECRMVEKESGITLAHLVPSTIARADGEVVQQREAVIDLPAMTVQLACSPDSFSVGVFSVREAQIMAFPMRNG